MLGLIAAAGVLLAGCDSTSDGSARSVSDSNQPASTGLSSDSSGAHNPDRADGDLPQNGAPAVNDPLDVGVVKDDLCAAITDDQAERFPGELVESGTDGEDYCTWKYEKDMFRLGYINGELDLDNPKGLSKYYGNVNEDIVTVDPVGSVNGYPAVQLDIGHTESGGCVITVGIRNDLTYTSHVVLNDDHPSYDEPCELAREFAGVVVDNLKKDQ